MSEAVKSMHSDIGFVLSASGHPAVISPEYVGTIVLKHLLKLTAMHLKHDRVSKAVIAVPAKFSTVQKAATGVAFQNAGLKVVRVLDEPTAAAVAYNLHKRQDVHHILVYDFGGGTLDVSILYVSHGSVQVYAADGDNFLGGSDFDMCLYNLVKSKIFEKTESLFWSDSSSSMNGRQGNFMGMPSNDSSLMCDSAAMHKKIETLKKRLSVEYIASFECVYVSRKPYEEIISIEVHRTDFEKSCEHLFDRGLIPVTRLLDELNM